MKKFKGFCVRTDNKYIKKAVFKHAKHLGYTFWDEDFSLRKRVTFCSDGDFFSYDSPVEKLITLDEFFKLTPEDVVVEPERWLYSFTLENHKGTDWKRKELTQDQIDRIKAIMGESDE
jgi:hypothetical protein